MAQFNATQLTAYGLILKAKGETNKLIKFTKIAVGDGVPGQGETVESLTALKAQKLQVAINSFDVLGGGISKATGIISNQGLAVGFYVREIGLFAKDPDTQAEKLYAYTYVSSAPDWLPPEGGPTLIESEIGMIAVVGNATNVTANIDDTVVVATKRDVSKILGIALDDGISQVMQGTSYVFPITDYDGFSTYAVDGWIDTTPLNPAYLYYQNEAFHLSIPNTITGSNLKMRLKKTTAGLDYYREITIPLFSGGIITPTITFPATNGTDVSTSPTLQASAFTPVPSGSQTHSQTNWQIATDANFSNLVVNVTNGTNLTSYPVPVSTLALKTKYYARVRYQGSVSGWGAWSGVVAFTTMPELKKFTLLVEDAFGEFYGGCEDNLGNVYCCGASSGKAYIAKFNSKLEKIAGKKFDYATGKESMTQVFFKIIYHDGFIYAAGRSKGTNIPAAFAFVKLDSNLNIITSKIYERTLASGTQIQAEITDLKAGGSDIYACGYALSEGASVKEGVVFRLDSSLNLLNKLLFHAANNGDKNLYPGALCVESSKISVLLTHFAGESGGGGYYAAFTIATVDRSLGSTNYRVSKNIPTIPNTTVFVDSASLVTDGTYYYMTCMPAEFVPDGWAFIVKLDASYNVVSAMKYNISQIPYEGAYNLQPSATLILGANNDIIFGGFFGYTGGNAGQPRRRFALLARVSRSTLARETSFVGFTNAINYYCKYNGFFINRNGSLIGYGAAFTGQGSENAIVQSLPANLSYDAYGPLPDLPEILLASAYMAASDITSLFTILSTYVTSTATFTLTGLTPVFVLTDDTAIEYSSEF